MKKTTFLTAGAAVAAIAIGGPVQADGPYIGIEGGVSFKDQVKVDIRPDDAAQDDDFTRAAIGRTKMGVDGDVILGYDFGAFRLEAEGGYKNNKYRGLAVFDNAILPTGVTVPSGTVVQNERDLEIWSGMVNALVEIGKEDGFQIYGGGGAGVARLELPVVVTGVGTIIDDKQTDFAWQLIGGVKVPVTDRIDLGVKYRYFNIDDFRLAGTNGSDLRAGYSVHSVLASLVYNFGARSQPEPEPMPTPPPPPPVVAPPPPPRPACNTGPFIVFFDFDRADVSPEAASILNNAVTAYANCGVARVMLAGHTDTAGSAQYNQGLAERRNQAVRSYIAARGIPEARITGQAFGESQPRVPTADGVREAQNRRVEVTYGPGSGM